MIGFKAYMDSDADLVAWWESSIRRTRYTIRELLRFAWAISRAREPADILADVRRT